MTTPRHGTRTSPLHTLDHLIFFCILNMLPSCHRLPILLLLLLLSLTHIHGKPRVAVEDPSLPSLSLHCLESEALSFLGDRNDFSDSYCGSTIRHVIERGWFDVAAKLVKECRARDFKMSGSIYKAKSNLNKQLNIVTNMLSGPSAVISPAFQWSQSKDYILLNVKFAHKLDTPATLGVKSKGADITANAIVFEAGKRNVHFYSQYNLPSTYS